MTLTVIFFASLAMMGLMNVLFLTSFMDVLRARAAQYMASLAMLSRAMATKMTFRVLLLAMLTLT
eukprot:5569869-Prorocentrum_lima.AAC.1